jgi:hypothetical protein
MCEKKVLRQIIGPKIDEVTGGWRRLHNEELHNLYLHRILLGDQVKEDEMDRVCDTHGQDIKCIQNFGWEA